MIEESARVVAVEGALLVLEADIKTACQSCTASKGCGTSLLAHHVGRKMTRLRVNNTIHAKAGDEIIIGLSERAMLTGSLLVYLLPLFAMIMAGLMVDAWLDPDLINDAGLPIGATADLLTALAAITAFLVSVLAVRSKLAGSRSQQDLIPVALRKKLVINQAISD